MFGYGSVITPIFKDGTDAEYSAKVFDSVYAYGKLFQRLFSTPHRAITIIIHFRHTVDPLVQTGTYLDVIDVPTQAENGGVPSEQY